MDLENIILSEGTQTQKEKYVLTYKWLLDIKQRKPTCKSQSQRMSTTRRLLRETYMDLIYNGSRKRQDLLSKLGAWGPCERIEGEGRGRKRSREKCTVEHGPVSLT